MPYAAPPTKIAGDVLTSALWNSFVQGNADSGFMRMLADLTVTGSVAANIDFQSIPATFAHLMVVLYARTDSATATFDNAGIRFNNDSAANYDYQVHSASAATPGAAESLAQTVASTLFANGGASPANLFAHNEIVISHYAGSANNKVADTRSGVKVGTGTGNLTTKRGTAFWRSSAAINRITLFPGNGNFAIGTRATLLGIPA